MRRNDWLIAAAVVAVLLAALLYDPSDRRPDAGGERGGGAGVVELPAVEAPAVATVELEAREREAAASELGTRFDRERVDAAWAEAARAELDASLARVVDDYDARLAEVDCRSSACRVRFEVADEARRPAAVAAALAALQRDGHATLLERAAGRQATLVIGVRTRRKP